MAEWTPIKSITGNAPDGGIIQLWHDSNLFNFTEWRTKGEFGKDLFTYFFIPAGFIHYQDNTFIFNFPVEWERRRFEVTGTTDAVPEGKYPVHSHSYADCKSKDIPLDNGLTESISHFLESEPHYAEMETDRTFKLPYLVVPDCKIPNFLPEKRFFIPVPEL